MTETDQDINQNVSDEVQPIIIVGQASGEYKNESVNKTFESKLLAVARPDGTTIIHDLNAGVRPLCYIQGAKVSVSRDQAEETLTFIAISEDGQELKIVFSEVIAFADGKDE